MLELLARPDTGANSMFAQGYSMERVSNHTCIGIYYLWSKYSVMCNYILATRVNKLIIPHRLALRVCRGRRTVKKTLLEEVQELEARAVDPGAAVLRDASGRRYVL